MPGTELSKKWYFTIIGNMTMAWTPTGVFAQVNILTRKFLYFSKVYLFTFLRIIYYSDYAQTRIGPEKKNALETRHLPVPDNRDKDKNERIQKEREEKQVGVVLGSGLLLLGNLVQSLDQILRSKNMQSTKGFTHRSVQGC